MDVLVVISNNMVVLQIHYYICKITKANHISHVNY